MDYIPCSLQCRWMLTDLSWWPCILGPCWGTTTTSRSPNLESVAKVGASSLTWGGGNTGLLHACISLYWYVHVCSGEIGVMWPGGAGSHLAAVPAGGIQGERGERHLPDVRLAHLRTSVVQDQTHVYGWWAGVLTSTVMPGRWWTVMGLSFPGR